MTHDYPNPVPTCRCGCGEKVLHRENGIWAQWKPGHNMRGPARKTAADLQEASRPARLAAQ